MQLKPHQWLISLFALLLLVAIVVLAKELQESGFIFSFGFYFIGYVFFVPIAWLLAYRKSWEHIQRQLLVYPLMYAVLHILSIGLSLDIIMESTKPLLETWGAISQVMGWSLLGIGCLATATMWLLTILLLKFGWLKFTSPLMESAHAL